MQVTLIFKAQLQPRAVLVLQVLVSKVFKAKKIWSHCLAQQNLPFATHKIGQTYIRVHYVELGLPVDQI